ncbi:hypothetical protein BDV96DRAFT_328004 [Lophiotrema nucula]|uniref:Uncharacterized protein n=1 Tax=Lophiotrema nucula TaxID=690887 RepID=A0A6A5YHA8_9PLEO|nr:hypothetical protein BDV96DRAFT_328004 [Lophiotrema nucula]
MYHQSQPSRTLRRILVFDRSNRPSACRPSSNSSPRHTRSNQRSTRIPPRRRNNSTAPPDYPSVSTPPYNIITPFDRVYSPSAQTPTVLLLPLLRRWRALLVLHLLALRLAVILASLTVAGLAVAALGRRAAVAVHVGQSDAHSSYSRFGCDSAQVGRTYDCCGYCGWPPW